MKIFISKVIIDVFGLHIYTHKNNVDSGQNFKFHRDFYAIHCVFIVLLNFILFIAHRLSKNKNK